MKKYSIPFLLSIFILASCGEGKKNKSGWSDSIVVDALIVASGDNAGQHPSRARPHHVDARASAQRH